MGATNTFLLERPHLLARAIFYSFSFLITFIIVLSWFATINITAAGKGIITTENGVKEIYINSNGVILEMFIKKGQKVKKGQVLATISSDEIEIANSIVKNTELSFKIAKQELTSIENVSKIEEFAAEQSLLRAKEQEQLSENLYKEGFTTKIAYLKAKDSLANAGANLEKTKNENLKNMNMAKAKLITITMENQNQKRKVILSNANRGNIDASRDGLDAIYSPCDGTVSLAQTWASNMRIDSKSPAFVIVPEDEELIAKIEIPTSKMTSVNKKQDVKLKIDAYPFKQFGVWQGELNYISASSKINLAGDTVYEAIVILDKKDMAEKTKSLLVGQTLNAEIVVERKRILIYLLDYLRGVSK